MKLRRGQIVEVNGQPATVIEVTKTMALIEIETMNGKVRKGVSRDAIG